MPGGDPRGVLGGITEGFPRGVLEGLPALDEPLHLLGDVRPPEKVRHVDPAYPELARRVRAQGTVILRIVIGREGAVEEVEVLRSHPLFDTAAIQAVRQWRYRPAVQAGRAVRVYQTVRVEFRLE